ncbi:rod shape-determining protein MreC [Hydrogenobacter sp. T-2]|uniref:rod shape-determining protein MreC n=1 Tax=Pampinifervens diazotrophicum TaxID=1632018 RepID=UPI002B2589E0|nr:rod shape-determining protein MreC [Hydrogenobacter sp. T-2]WPM31883.1 rod shape-determining protein MreC [Hydrogenobacter sp. T-2]
MKSYVVPFTALLLSVVVYFINFSTLPYLNQVYNFLRLAVYPLLELKGNIQENTRRIVETYLFLKNVSEENNRLRKEVEEYKLYKAQLFACENNLKSLSQAMNIPFNPSKYSIVYANVVAYDPSGRDTFVLINRGQDKGISEGMLSFSGEGLVGIVDSVYGSSSRIRTVFSEEFTLSAGVGDKAYIYRGGFPTGSLLHVKLDDEINIGDVVYVRVPGRTFPQFKIGTVEEVYHDGKGFFKKVKVKPYLDIRKVSLLVVIRERL